MRSAQQAVCLRVLRETFHKDDFRPGQKEAAFALLDGRDVMGILPTGAGKSLCYQLPALVMEGTTLIVSPLIALMRDQVRHLRQDHVPAVCLDSLMEREDYNRAMTQIHQGQVKMVYASPERLQSPSFRGWWMTHPPSMIVVDEAHCVVRWGEDFRPAYGQIGGFVKELPARPVLCAMTATADRGMRRAIADSLGMRRIKLVMLPVVRENLRYQVLPTLKRDEALLDQLTNVRITAPEGKCVVFCRTRRRTEEVAALCQRYGEMSAAAYHAGMPREERRLVQERFFRGEIHILAATSAFGMGIDMPDIRLVIHDSLPDHLLDYAQQTGRAGRDGMAARCVLLLDPYDLEMRRRTLKRLHKGRGISPIARWIGWQKAWRETKRVLRWCLSGRCLSAGIPMAMGQSAPNCGRCSACLGKQTLPTCIPNLSVMQDWQLRQWVLRWERAAMARKSGVAAWKILPGRALTHAARTGKIPPKAMTDAAMEARMQAILCHMTSLGSTWQD